MEDSFIVAAGMIAVPFAIVFIDGHRRLRREKADSRSPFTEKLLRPAGESLRQDLDRLYDRGFDLVLWLATVLICPLLFVAVMLYAPFDPQVKLIMNLGVGLIPVVGTLVIWSRLVKLRGEIRNHRLGFDGERYVAAELNSLMADGYRVFHDLVVDDKPGGESTNFNIDHVVVGPTGVYVIETKAKRKPFAERSETQPIHKIVYTGKELILPGGYTDASWLAQARRNAEWVAKWLQGSSDKAFEVVPIVAFPGWFVEGERGADVHVLNPKRRRTELPKLGHRKLSPEQVERAATRFEQKCRNIEPQ